MHAPPTRRGRPKEADPAAVAAIALALFAQHGLEGVTMDDVAAAADISRRTLFRMFPSKADLVWDGLDVVVTGAHTLVAGYGTRRLTLREVVDELLTPALSFVHTGPYAALARQRLRLVATYPALLAHPPIGDLKQLLRDVVETHVDLGGRPPGLIADSLVAVTVSAVLWWAVHGGDSDPLVAVHAAFASVAAAI